MLSHELAEVREIGARVKEVAKAETPTLVKYADAVPYLVETGKEIRGIENREWNPSTSLRTRVESREWCSLVNYDGNGEDKVLAAALYRFGEMAYADALEYVKSLGTADLEALAESLLGRLGKYDVPLRELEYSTYTFDLVMDQGAYAEFKRHRMMTQTPQLLTTRLGYVIPRLIEEAGYRAQYEAAMQKAEETYEKLAAWNPYVAQYVVPNGCNRRVLAQFNLRSAYHFCQLRAAANAHYSIRRIAERVAGEIQRVHPMLSMFMSLPEETWQDVEKNYFA